MQSTLYNQIMSKKVPELLFQIGLVLGSIVIGKLLDSPFGYVVAAILAIAFITQWLLQREKSEREVEMEGLFGGPIPLRDGRQTSEIELPEVRPKIVPVDYCKNEKNNLYGLHLRNSGYDALDVEIPDVPIGKSGYILEFPGRLALLGERSGIGFLEAWLKHETLPELDGGQLHEVMSKAGVESINLSVVYKDTDLHPKKTECAIDRTNRERHGLSVRATSAPGIPVLSAPQPRKEPEPPLPKPTIDWFTWGFPAVAYDAERGLWTDYDDVHTKIYKACAIYVTNNLDDATARGTHAARLRAQISWTYAHEAIGPRFSPAPWIGEELGQIELPVGVTKRILIAVRDTTWQFWTGYSNFTIGTKPTDSDAFGHRAL